MSKSSHRRQPSARLIQPQAGVGNGEIGTAEVSFSQLEIGDLPLYNHDA